MSRNADGGLPLIGNERTVAELERAIRKLRNIHGHNGITVVNGGESVDIILSRVLQESVGGGGGTTLLRAKLYGYVIDEGGNAIRFRGKFAAYALDESENPIIVETPVDREEHFYVQRFPVVPDIRDHRPLMYFDAPNYAWVPVTPFIEPRDPTNPNDDIDPDPPPGTPPPSPLVTHWYIVPWLIGVCPAPNPLDMGGSSFCDLYRGNDSGPPGPLPVFAGYNGLNGQ